MSSPDNKPRVQAERPFLDMTAVELLTLHQAAKTAHATEQLVQGQRDAVAAQAQLHRDRILRAGAAARAAMETAGVTPELLARANEAALLEQQIAAEEAARVDQLQRSAYGRDAELAAAYSHQVQKLLAWDSDAQLPGRLAAVAVGVALPALALAALGASRGMGPLAIVSAAATAAVLVVALLHVHPRIAAHLAPTLLDKIHTKVGDQRRELDRRGLHDVEPCGLQPIASTDDYVTGDVRYGRHVKQVLEWAATYEPAASRVWLSYVADGGKSSTSVVQVLSVGNREFVAEDLEGRPLGSGRVYRVLAVQAIWFGEPA